LLLSHHKKLKAPSGAFYFNDLFLIEYKVMNIFKDIFISEIIAQVYTNIN